MSNNVQPKPVVAPSGAMSHPKIVERVVGKKIIREAHWYDPQTGQFFLKGTIEVVDVA